MPAFAIEGTGSYGAGLARFLAAAGVEVFECERPRRAERRRGKSDLIDAALAARRLRCGEPLSLPRAEADARSCACCCSSDAERCRRGTLP